MLIILPYADVLVLYTLQDNTVLCYIHKLQSQIPYADMLVLCKLQDKTVCKIQENRVLCYKHYIMQNIPIAISFSILERIKENISVKLLAIHNV
jgi:hypothetical protein